MHILRSHVLPIRWKAAELLHRLHLPVGHLLAGQLSPVLGRHTLCFHLLQLPLSHRLQMQNTQLQALILVSPTCLDHIQHLGLRVMSLVLNS